MPQQQDTRLEEMPKTALWHDVLCLVDDGIHVYGEDEGRGKAVLLRLQTGFLVTWGFRIAGVLMRSGLGVCL